MLSDIYIYYWDLNMGLSGCKAALITTTPLGIFYVYIHIYLCIYIYVYTYIFMYIYIYVYKYIYIYMYLYMDFSSAINY